MERRYAVGRLATQCRNGRNSQAFYEQLTANRKARPFPDPPIVPEFERVSREAAEEESIEECVSDGLGRGEGGIASRLRAFA